VPLRLLQSVLYLSLKPADRNPLTVTATAPATTVKVPPTAAVAVVEDKCPGKPVVRSTCFIGITANKRSFCVDL
jgi:hypothetical protein